MPRLSVIVPVLDEARAIEAALAPLQPHRGEALEVLVVDGGSVDATRSLAAPLADRVLRAPKGRASQMNAGAALAAGDILLFLHADTILPADAPALVQAAVGGARAWGRFDVAIAGAHPALALVALLMNARSRLTGIATGDQAMFVRREGFPGFPEIALMEDVALSRLLKRRARPSCLREKAVTSGRRWESRGVVRTIVLMWGLRLAYFLGAPAKHLIRFYRP